MKVCHCNPFSSKDVDRLLKDGAGQDLKTMDVYRTCSGADQQNCGQCLPVLNDMVKAHNKRNEAVRSIKDQMPGKTSAPAKTSETVE